MTAEPIRTSPAARETTVAERRVAIDPVEGWLGVAARAGYVAKGVVYVVIGVLAFGVALGLADEAAGSPEAIELVAALPLGRLFATILGVGLAGYATLSFVAAVHDPEGHGRDAGGLATRVVDAFTGIVYLGLTAIALRLVATPSRSDGGWLTTQLAALLESAAGAWLVGAVGVGLTGAGLWLAYKAAALAHLFGARLDRRQIGARSRAWVVRLARAGTVARGAAFAFCGLLLVAAALRNRAADARGLGQALATLGHGPAGPPLLAAVAVGFVAYGAYQLAKARFRRLTVE